MRIAKPAALTAALVLAALASGCAEAPRDPFERGVTTDKNGQERRREGITDHERDKAEVDRLIAELQHGKDAADVAAMARYDKAKDALIQRGARIETVIIDTLRSHRDWSVRLGCVEVLQGIGTKASVEHLIAVTDDPNHLVARKANDGLQAMTKRTMVTWSGASGTSAAALPPVTSPAKDDLDPDRFYTAWSAWHLRHGKQLRQAWTDWWTANRATFKVD